MMVVDTVASVCPSTGDGYADGCCATDVVSSWVTGWFAIIDVVVVGSFSGHGSGSPMCDCYGVAGSRYGGSAVGRCVTPRSHLVLGWVPPVVYNVDYEGVCHDCPDVCPAEESDAVRFPLLVFVAVVLVVECDRSGCHAFLFLWSLTVMSVDYSVGSRWSDSELALLMSMLVPGAVCLSELSGDGCHC